MDDDQKKFAVRTRAFNDQVQAVLDEIKARGFATPGEIEALEALREVLRKSRKIIADFESP